MNEKYIMEIQIYTCMHLDFSTQATTSIYESVHVHFLIYFTLEFTEEDIICITQMHKNADITSIK